MKALSIVHVSLASSFTENMSYQENYLTSQNIKDGHKVTIISNASKFINGVLVDVPEEDIILSNGLRLIRIKYKHFLTKKISKKIRIVKGLYTILNELKPDIIFSHSTSYYSLVDCIKYVKKHSNVRIVADNHATIFNSGKNLISDLILHRCIFRSITKKTVNYLSAYYYIGVEEYSFARKKYRVPEHLLKFFPLGGRCAKDNEYFACRNSARKKLKCKEDTILFVHSGKLDYKKKTKELVEAFCSIKDDRFMLAIIGSFNTNEDEDIIINWINTDARIKYVGWKDEKELFNYLCACDIYCQPGSVSATLQNAICCRCAIMSYPHETYVDKLNNGNFYWTKNVNEIRAFFYNVSCGNLNISAMKEKSQEIALKVLDYEILAKKMYEDCGF